MEIIEFETFCFYSFYRVRWIPVNGIGDDRE